MAVSDSLLVTRDTWHRLAEQVLSAARYAATGRIGLVPVPDGFAAPVFGFDSTVLAVDVDELVVTRAGQQRRTRIVPWWGAGASPSVSPAPAGAGSDSRRERIERGPSCRPPTK